MPVTSTTGLASGIDTASIIDQLMKLEQAPKDALQARVDTAGKQKDAYSTLLKGVSDLRNTALSLQLPSTFKASTATSSNDDVLSATASNGATVGSYQFQVARLVTAQQSISTGFADYSNQRVGAGTITVEMGGGEVNTETLLADLNGGAGVQRGQFRITDRSGGSALIDASAAVSLEDVVKQINNSLDVRVKASINGDKLVLTDASGSSAQNFIVQDLGSGQTATDLGIATAPSGVAGSTITGSDIHYLATSTSLSKLNDGLGIRTAASSADDIKVTTKDGNTYSVNLANARTIGDVASEFDSATGGKVKITLNVDGNGLIATDSSAGGSAFSIAAANGSKAASDLGLLTAPAGNVVNGGAIFGGINTVLLKTLNGGQGLTLGQLKITDRSGKVATIDLSGASTLQDVLDTINSTTTGGFSVKASVKDSGNGIQIADGSGGSGDLVIEDISAGTATALGLAGTFDNTTPVAVGKNLQRQWVNENSLLSSLNGGKGMAMGVMKVTSSTGAVANIDLSGVSYTTLGQVLKAINDKTTAIGVTASINANGDGVLLTDTAAGATKLKVEDKSGTMAASLNLRGQATANTIDGSYEKTITVAATDTLTDVTRKFSDLSYGVTANVINDGSGASPFRLSLTALNSGLNGRVVLDSGTTGLGTRQLVEAQDAAVFVGGSSGAEPLLVTGSSNQLTGILPGVNIDLHSVSKNPVSLNVSRSPDSLVDTMNGYVKGFNDLVDGIGILTAFDSTTNTAGLLMGDSAIQGVQNALYEGLTKVVTGAGQYRTLADVGLTITDGAKLDFDEDKFRAAYSANPTDVEKLFTSMDSITTTKTTVGGTLTNGASGGSFINNLITGGTTTTTTTTNGPTVPNGTTTDGGTSTTVDGVTTTTGATIFQNTTTTVGKGFAYLIEKALTKLTDPVDGLIPRTNDNIDLHVADYRARIDALTDLLTQKRTRLETQFANMESAISSLQSQQSALNSFQPVSYNSSK